MNFSLLPASSGAIHLVIAPHAGTALITETAARLALAGQVRVLDCGNRFNVYPVAKAVRRLTAEMDPVLDRILLSRAFTCYQVLALLRQETSPRPAPILVVDLLATFLDENIPLTESRRLLTLSAERASLLEALMQTATAVYRLEDPSLLPEPQLQGMLFSADQL
jgi:hypothetical protein